MARWTPEGGGARVASLAAFLALALAAPAAADDYGAGDPLNTPSEAATALQEVEADGNTSALEGLSATELDYFEGKALEGTVEAGGGEPVAVPGEVPETQAELLAASKKERYWTKRARAGHPYRPPARTKGTRVRAQTAATYYWTWTPYCWFKNYLGGTLWRYNSHWSWSGGGVRVFTATHSEYPSNVAYFWEYDWSKYLWASGGLYTSYIGRATQGKFHASLAIQGFGFNESKYPVHDVHVHGDGSVWHSCTGY